jgi:hypothetical protein
MTPDPRRYSTIGRRRSTPSATAASAGRSSAPRPRTPAVQPGHRMWVGNEDNAPARTSRSATCMSSCRTTGLLSLSPRTRHRSSRADDHIRIGRRVLHPRMLRQSSGAGDRVAILRRSARRPHRHRLHGQHPRAAGRRGGRQLVMTGDTSKFWYWQFHLEQPHASCRPGVCLGPEHRPGCRSPRPRPARRRLDPRGGQRRHLRPAATA